MAKTGHPHLGAPPTTPPDAESTQAALDELFAVARKYNSSDAYLAMLQFVGRFRFYSPFNAMLIYAQMPGARFVSTPLRWRRGYHRDIKVTARPIVILQPMGPVLFVFDVSDTEALPNAPPLPAQAERPFAVHGGKIGMQLPLTIENAKRDGIRASDRADGSQRAGSIQWATGQQYLEVTISKKPILKTARVPLWFELVLNSKLSAEANFATLVHELAHLYCGHLGTPNDRWWPDRQHLSHAVREFEAESVSYLVCTRLGIDSGSAEYLAGYVRNFPAPPPISLDRVMKSAWLIEQMGRGRLGLRKGADSQA